MRPFPGTAGAGLSVEGVRSFRRSRRGGLWGDCHGMWLLYLHSRVKIQLFFIFPLADAMLRPCAGYSFGTSGDKASISFEGAAFPFQVFSAGAEERYGNRFGRRTACRSGML